MGGDWRVASLMPGHWRNRAEFEAWWRENVIAFNRLSVTDPREWERIAQAIEAMREPRT